jgi:hypothetical protein
VNTAPVVLSDCETKVGSWVSTCGVYSLVAPRGPPTCISLVPTELSGCDGAEGPSACRASDLHPNNAQKRSTRK